MPQADGNSGRMNCSFPTGPSGDCIPLKRIKTEPPDGEIIQVTVPGKWAHTEQPLALKIVHFSKYKHSIQRWVFIDCHWHITGFHSLHLLLSLLQLYCAALHNWILQTSVTMHCSISTLHNACSSLPTLREAKSNHCCELLSVKRLTACCYWEDSLDSLCC